MKNRDASGYLLAETLLVLALISAAFLAFSDSFSAARGASRRSSDRRQEENCLQTIWLESSTGIRIQGQHCSPHMKNAYEELVTLTSALK